MGADVQQVFGGLQSLVLSCRLLEDVSPLMQEVSSTVYTALDHHDK